VKHDGGTGPKRRVSFLMPYIDFCFMLIIIFVAMISIAYFEPLGVSNFQTKEEKKLDQTEGRFETRPAGIEMRNAGVGVTVPAAAARPLGGRRSEGPTPLIPRGEAKTASPAALKTSGHAPKPGAGKFDKKPGGPGDVPKEELEKLKKQLAVEKMKREALEAQVQENKGIGNHLYIDLRNK
jgi:hypothetical protein